ncbi:MAG: hypothetical protein DMG74_05350 [Acidobacteria bacterium]|nr:MAG: hypothetical protein DMG74_05350 [Acidobacteriota bacterium]
MRTCVILLSAILLAPSILLAQETAAPKAEIFGGYSYLRNNNNGFNGWTGQGTVNLSRYFGITAQLDGNYRSAISFSPLPGITASANQQFYDFLVGPTATARFGKNAVFAHALFGAARSSLSGVVGLPLIGDLSTPLKSATGFAMDFGGGVDIGVTPRFAIRAVQIDYLHTQLSSFDALSTGFFNGIGGHQNSFRYSAGVVFRF